MTIKHFGLVGFICYLLSFSAWAEKEIAITIDDLPFVGTNDNKPGNLQRAHDRFLKILKTLQDEQVPATGFVIAGSIAKGQWELLQQFHEGGFVIGNHTYTHPNAYHLTAEQYINEIEHADQVLSPLMTEEKYFRFPYLAEGRGEQKKQIEEFLNNNHYTVAPVTIDSKDYEFNERLLRIHWRERKNYLNSIRRQFLAFVWSQTLRAEKRDKDQPAKQILLVHANLLESHFLGDLIQMYKKNGYTFITLAEALKNPAPPIVFTPKAEIFSDEDMLDVPMKTPVDQPTEQDDLNFLPSDLTL